MFGGVASSSDALPGPRLLEPQAKLDAALNCPPDLSSSNQPPVLLVPGTLGTVQQNYGSNFLQRLPREGYPVCTVAYPDKGVTDLQVGVEYVAYAIREVARRAQRKIAVIGHSQGAFLPGYALRFWPDLARKVDDFVGFAGPWAHGTTLSYSLCNLPCGEAFRQFKPDSAFTAAVADVAFPSGPSYTSFLTRTDELVTPQPLASTIVAPGARNYILQDLCPSDITEHITMVYAEPFVALTLDALAHPGPASTQRTGQLPCGLIPETPAGVPGLAMFAVQGIVAENAAHPAFEAPPLRCYLDPGCAKPRLRPTLVVRTTPKRDPQPPFAFKTRGTLELPEGTTGQCAGTVGVQIKRGRRTMSRRTVPVLGRASPTGPDCAFRSRVKLSRTEALGCKARSPRRQRRLRVIVRYAGAAQLLPAAHRRHVRAGPAGSWACSRSPTARGRRSRAVVGTHRRSTPAR